MAVLLAATVPRSLPLPLPPPPAPPDPQEPVRAAPVPNRDIAAPPPATIHPEVMPQMFRGHGTGINQGFLPGSEFQSDEDRRVITTPGVSVRLPIP